MADQLYLSLWFPNFRLDALPEKLTGVLNEFAKVANNHGRVAVASAIPLGWNESPVFQRIFVNDDRSQESEDSLAINAVAEATEQLHDDMAYQFETRWQLWQPEIAAEGFDMTWRPEPATVTVTGFGPEFDDSSYEQNGHIRVDFGLDTRGYRTKTTSTRPGRRACSRTLKSCWPSSSASKSTAAFLRDCCGQRAVNRLPKSSSPRCSASTS